MHRFGIVATVGLLALAGCSGGVPAPISQTPSLTPVAVPADGAPVLVSRAGVPDPAALLAAHRRELADRAYRVTVAESVFVDGRLAYGRRANVTVDGDRSLARIETERVVRDETGSVVSAATTVRSSYADADRVVVLHDSGVVSVASVPTASERPVDTTRTAQLSALFGAADLRVANALTHHGNYRVYAIPFVVPALPTSRGPVANATVERLYAPVTQAGHITGYWVRYAGTWNGTAVTGTVAVDYELDRPISPPEWIDGATTATG